MADRLPRTEPVPTEALQFSGATIALGPPMARWSLRARDRGALEAATSLKLPGKIGEIKDASLCLGPDEWLLRAPIGTTLSQTAGKPVSVVDVSERQVAISVEGSLAVDVILAGSPLDLENFPVGRGKRTIFEGVEVILIRESETRFILEVWRSFAEFVWGVLAKAASEL